MEINEILLFGLSKPDNLIIEFWKKHQKESGYSKKGFWLELNECWQCYNKKIEALIDERVMWGNNTTNTSISLLTETLGKVPGRLDKYGLEKLHKKLTEYGLKLGAVTVPNTEPPQQTETKPEKETENNLMLSTIEDWLFEFKEKMSEPDYNKLISALTQYFETGTFPAIDKQIKVSGVNIKLFGWHLNRIYQTIGKGKLSKDYLLFAKQNISLFTDVSFDENDILKSNLYKYFTTKTK